MNSLQGAPAITAGQNSVPAPTDGAPNDQRSRERHSRPVFTHTLEINSLQAQKVMDRSFQRVANSLFSIDVILRIIAEQGEIDQIEEVISGHIQKVAEDLDKTTAQLQELLDKHGIDELPGYTKPAIYNAEVTSPQVAMFIHLIRKLDSLMGIIDALWLNGVLTNKQRSDATYEWQQRLIRLAGRIIGFEKRARISAHTKGKSDEIASEAPEAAEFDSDIPEELSDDDAVPAAEAAPTDEDEPKETGKEKAKSAEKPKAAKK